MLLANIVIRTFFFFKQKTAYEMCISDWSSDVCSSDLVEYGPFQIAANGIGKQGRQIFQQTLFAGYRTFAANAGRAEQVDQVHEQCWAVGMMRVMQSMR